MWTLSQARARLTQRLAEVSEVFWSNDERDAAINDAQRLIAAITRGVPQTITGNVSVAQPWLAVTGKLIGEYAVTGQAAGRALISVPIEAAGAVFPNWRTFPGSPRWAFVSPHEGRVYFSPVPPLATSVTVNVSVLPTSVVGDADPLFLSERTMEKYLNPLLNFAAAYCLLKERYDGDAERFYQMGVQELGMLGVNPAMIPSLKQEAPDA
jgi:hypothetical protein